MFDGEAPQLSFDVATRVLVIKNGLSRVAAPLQDSIPDMVPIEENFSCRSKEDSAHSDPSESEAIYKDSSVDPAEDEVIPPQPSMPDVEDTRAIDFTRHPPAVPLRCPPPLFLDEKTIRLVEQPGKGRGFIAIQDIEPGHLLMRERPFFRPVSPNWGNGSSTAAEVVNLACDEKLFGKVESAVNLLELHPQLESMGEMASEKRMEDLIIRIKTGLEVANAKIKVKPQHRMVALLLQIEMNCFAGGMFAYGSMFNHECIPNALVRMINVEGSILMEVRTKRKILAGQEVCISYQQDSISGFPGMPFDLTAARQEKLQSHYGFRCTCRACTSATSSTQYEATLSDGSDKHVKSISEKACEIAKDMASPTRTPGALYRKALLLWRFSENIIGPRHLIMYRVQGLVRRLAAMVINAHGAQVNDDVVLEQLRAGASMLETMRGYTSREDMMALSTLNFLLNRHREIREILPHLLPLMINDSVETLEDYTKDLEAWREAILASHSDMSCSVCGKIRTSAEDQGSRETNTPYVCSQGCAATAREGACKPKGVGLSRAMKSGRT